MSDHLVVGGGAFKALDKHGYCPHFKGMCEWNKAIQKMIDAFELLKYNSSFSEEEQKTITEGLDLFCIIEICGINLACASKRHIISLPLQ